MTTFREMTVDDWGGKWKGVPPLEKLPDGETYVHHVGGAAKMGNDAVRVFQDLNAYAQNVKGYQFLDYDILMHYDFAGDVVTIAEGRGRFRSAATLDRNEQGEAIVACGNYSLREPVQAELEGIARGIVYGIERGWIVGSTVILGHRDNPAHPNATACPGTKLYPYLPWIRARVAAILNPPEDDMVNWKPTPETVAAIKTMPSVVETLANKADDWAATGLVKAVQIKAGLTVTGIPDQATWDAANRFLAGK